MSIINERIFDYKYLSVKFSNKRTVNIFNNISANDPFEQTHFD